MFFSDSPGPIAQRALANLRPSIFWLDDPTRPDATSALADDITCDLLVVGGGFSGLWTALLAKQADPTRDVVLLEAGRIADGATGRNGGFVSPSLTHGILNGANRWPDDLRTLVRMGRENLDAIESTVAALGIDCDFRRAGEMAVAVQEHQIDELRETAEIANAHGDHVRILGEDQIRSLIHSDSYLGGIADPDVALVNPAALAWGLLRACQDLRVRVYEHSPVRELNDVRKRVIAMTDQASITARHVAVATNAYPSIVKKMAKYVVPVYDYVLVTEPLTDEQWEAIGWDGREGLSDAGNQFHYYRPTADGRILWGGYDAVYHRNNGVNAKFDFDDEAFGRLAEHFFQTFPQLAGLSFTHGWGGAIDTCSRFSPFWGLDHAGKTAYVAGYTGLGVGASRFGAQVMLDLLAGNVNERTELEMVQTKPIPFPPEPFRSLGINWTTKSMQSADRHEGRRNLWLKALDKVGLGFDS
jgi:glycine/D-amino acid oxidase-like deaminating enzyme